MITTVLFDLDGTLLPMDQDRFIGAYMKGLAMTAAPLGYEPKSFGESVTQGTIAMIKNKGERTNETVFWDTLTGIYGEKIQGQTHIFDEFYRTEFQNIRSVCGYTPKSAELLRWVKQLGFRVALATSPLFPKIATESRIRWAGLAPEDFELFTTFEDYHYCKPNIHYYEEVCAALKVRPEECLMVGNDAREDLVAEELGMKVFLLTDCLINRKNIDFSAYPHGSFAELTAYIQSLRP